MPVGYRHFGRMGNFLYQTAAAIGYAKKHGLKYSVPSQTNDAKWNPLYLQHLVDANFEQGREDILINEVGHDYQEIPFEEAWRNQYIQLNGYWQSYKYYDFMMAELLDLFNFPYEMNKGVCSIHVRRGDYLLYPTRHPVVTVEYLSKAINTIIDRVGIGIKFKIFSDDIEWCKDAIPGIYGELCEFSEGKTELEDLILMANCEHNICSNSTMSTWASELNRNPNKIVIVPSEDNWFGLDNKHLEVKDMYRPEWVQIAY